MVLRSTEKAEAAEESRARVISSRGVSISSADESAQLINYDGTNPTQVTTPSLILQVILKYNQYAI